MRRVLLLLTVLGALLWPAIPASADVTTEFALGILTVNGDAQANAIVVACANGNVRVNDRPPTGGRVRCSSVQSILVRAGDGPDRVVLTDVGRPAFDILLDIGVFGEAGNDTLIGGPLAEQLAGGSGLDVLRGGGGSDRLFPGGGDGVLVGGKGRDRATMFGGGDWAVNDERIAHGSEVTTLQSVEIVAIKAGDGDDTIIGVAFEGALELDGGAGDDELRSGSGRDHLLGRDGADVLFSGSGADILEGGNGGDELHGGPGDDQLLGGQGDDSCAGGEGADSLLSC
jgi:Ca2+-binding RTX toxin-like protein